MADNTRLKMLAALLAQGRLPSKNTTPAQSAIVNALAQRPAPPTTNWLSRPLPMEGRFNMLPLRETGASGLLSTAPKREWALPGILAGAVNAFTAPGRAMRGQPGFNPEQEGVNMALNFMGAGLGASRMAPAPRGSVGMNAYHGSPHKFDAFSMEKIGTGEGAQAYGHGLYFAENPNIAKSYQTTLAYKAFDVAAEAEKRGISLNAGGRGEFIRQARANPTDPARAAKYLQYANADSRNIPVEKLTELFSAYNKDGGGALYHVDIPDEAVGRMLDWDKPLSDQHRKQLVQLAGRYPELRYALEHKGTTGGGFYGAAAAAMGDTTGAKLSAELNRMGIPGIRYLDQASRAAGKGTRNFVLFDDKLAKITKRE